MPTYNLKIVHISKSEYYYFYIKACRVIKVIQVIRVIQVIQVIQMKEVN